MNKPDQPTPIVGDCTSCGSVNEIAGEPTWTGKPDSWEAIAIFTCEDCGNEREVTFVPAAYQAQLIETIKLMDRVFNEALPKFNWGASALDANAIDLLNRGGMAVTQTMLLIKAKEESA